MGLKKHLNKVLALGLTVVSVYVSTHSVYALNEDTKKEEVKTNSKIELTIDKEEVKTTKRAIVTTSVLNVREEASQESEKIGALVEGNVVTVLETKEEWIKVQLSDEKEGWVSNEFIANEKAKVNVAELNLRKETSTEGDKLETLKRNTELEVLSVLEIENKEEETTDVWYEVKVIENESSEEEKSEDKEDKIGFVFAEYTLTESEEAKLKEEARKKAEAEKKASEEAQKTVQANTAVSNATSNNSSSTSEKQPAKETASSSNLAGSTITVNASAYSGHGITATGTVPKWGTIAVDPSVIPYGTKVYIPMFDKVFIAEDCGGAIKGNKIDIFMNSSQETTNFGRRNIEIKILG